jgi:hypothetical protein
VSNAPLRERPVRGPRTSRAAVTTR